MPRQVYSFDHPDRFVVGTVGMPGERTFYLQVSDGSRIISVVLEKLQVSLLADRLAELLEEARSRLDADVPDEDSGPVEQLVDEQPLSTPVEAEFQVGSLGLIWDAGSDTVVVEAAAVAENDVPAAERDLLEVRMSPVHAWAFVVRANHVISAGRPPCPLCGQPLEAAGHVCPRQNGYRRVVAF